MIDAVLQVMTHSEYLNTIEVPLSFYGQRPDQPVPVVLITQRSCRIRSYIVSVSMHEAKRELEDGLDGIAT